MVDIHSTKHTCRSCGEVFPTKSDWSVHVDHVHGFTYTNGNSANQEMECHDCEGKFANKFELMQHKREAHYKKRLCSYWHGTGWGCRFPASQCLNIHNENITPVLSGDNRSKIQCRDGESCHFDKKNSCHYKHTSKRLTSQVPSNKPDSEEVVFLERKKCSQCNYETNTETEIKYHIEVEHGARKKDYQGIKASGFPIGHAQWAAGRNANAVEHKCTECPSVFNIESMLNAHISRAHNTNYGHICSQCKNVFNNQEEVNEHIKKTHSNQNLETVFLKISNQMNTISQRLESLEQRSLTNFPNLGPQLERK